MAVSPSLMRPTPGGAIPDRFVGPPVRPAGEWNTVRIVFRGPTAVLLMNSQRMGLPLGRKFNFGPGSVALGIANGNGNVGIEYDRLTIWPLKDTEPNPTELNRRHANTNWRAESAVAP